jgi:hypothetical protein
MRAIGKRQDKDGESKAAQAPLARQGASRLKELNRNAFTKFEYNFVKAFRNGVWGGLAPTNYTPLGLTYKACSW